MIAVLKLITNIAEGNDFGVESERKRCLLFFSADNVGALVIVGELERYEEVHRKSAYVIEGEEVVTLRPEERVTQKLFADTD